MTDITDNDMAQIEGLASGLGDALELGDINQKNINKALCGLTGAIMVICVDQRDRIKHLQSQVTDLQKLMNDVLKEQ